METRRQRGPWTRWPTSDGNTHQTPRLDSPAQAMSKARESPDPKFLTLFPNLHKSSNILKWFNFIARLQWKNSSGNKVSRVDLRCFCLGAECRVTRWQECPCRTSVVDVPEVRAGIHLAVGLEGAFWLPDLFFFVPDAYGALTLCILLWFFS